MPSSLPSSLRLATRAIVVVAALVAFGFVTTVVPLYYYGFVGWGYGVGVLIQMDITVTKFIAVPLAGAAIFFALASSHRDADVVNALALDENPADKAATQGPLGRARSFMISLWTPRFRALSRFSSLFSSWSRGDIVISVILILTNIAWWIVPVIVRNYASPYPLPMGTFRDWVDAFALMAGIAGTWDAGLAVIFAIRENQMAKAVAGNDAGQYHRVIRFHIALGYTSFGLLAFHSLYYPVIYAIDNTMAKELLPWVSDAGYFNFFGIISFVGLIGMVSTSIFKVRRKNYRLFYWGHQLYVIFFLFAIQHAKMTWYQFLFSVVFFVFDRLLPRLKTLRNTHAMLTRVSPTIVRIDVPISPAFADSSLYAPGDWVNVLVPSVSWLNWHAFSIASFAHTSPNIYSIFVKERGSWTSKVVGLGAGEGVVVPVKIDGVFGARTTLYLEHEHLVLVGAGTGLAALIPYLFQYARSAKGRITLVWIARTAAEASVYRELLDALADKRALGSRVNLHLHLTREQAHPTPVSPITDAFHGVDLVRNNSDSPNAALVDNKTPIAATSKHAECRDIEYADSKDDHKIFVLSQAKPGSAADSRLTAQPVLAGKTAVPPKWIAPFGLLSAALAVVVFGGGIAGFYAGRLITLGSNEETCPYGTSYLHTGKDYFYCWYWMYWAPPMFSMLFSALGGYLFTVAVTLLRTAAAGSATLEMKRDEAEDALAETQRTLQPLSADAFARSFSWKTHRPDLDSILGGVFASAGNIPGAKVAVMAAGPERMVLEAERVTIAGGHSFFRESFKCLVRAIDKKATRSALRLFFRLEKLRPEALAQLSQHDYARLASSAVRSKELASAHTPHKRVEMAERIWAIGKRNGIPTSSMMWRAVAEGHARTGNVAAVEELLATMRSQGLDTETPRLLAAQSRAYLLAGDSDKGMAVWATLASKDDSKFPFKHLFRTHVMRSDRTAAELALEAASSRFGVEKTKADEAYDQCMMMLVYRNLEQFLRRFEDFRMLGGVPYGERWIVSQGRLVNRELFGEALGAVAAVSARHSGRSTSMIECDALAHFGLGKTEALPALFGEYARASQAGLSQRLCSMLVTLVGSLQTKEALNMALTSNEYLTALNQPDAFTALLDGYASLYDAESAQVVLRESLGCGNSVSAATQVRLLACIHRTFGLEAAMSMMSMLRDAGITIGKGAWGNYRALVGHNDESLPSQTLALFDLAEAGQK
ncbi:oxidoreductase activity, acting on NAD(P)H, oxygen as acceptor [Polyrhizophydium stewartii]|uniref:Oxidoreductase activity, acting on NAD(P)H, oxygen as acceptor n=1 Tax=Polyrhizophydium stewartii TaxID=2732419 RepID=A0ABR4NEU9_9FUNG